MSRQDLYIFHGRLGSGKTTAIQHIRNMDKFKDSVVIENELASENIDQDKLGGRNVYDISGLCVCCSTGNELNDALNKAYNHSEAQPVILETTGAANLVNVLKKILTDSEFNDKYSIASSIFVIGLQPNLDVGEMASEILVSDTVILNKTDLVDEETVKRYSNEIREIKEEVEIVCTQNSEIGLDKLSSESSLNQYLAEAVSENIGEGHQFDRYEVVEGLEFESEKQFKQRFEQVSNRFSIGRMKGVVKLGEENRFVEYSSGKLSLDGEKPVTNKLVVIGDDSIYEAVQEIQKA